MENEVDNGPPDIFVDTNGNSVATCKCCAVIGFTFERWFASEAVPIVLSSVEHADVCERGTLIVLAAEDTEGVNLPEMDGVTRPCGFLGLRR